MNTLKINYLNNNAEILSKILNSVARKYDCQVRFDAQQGRVSYVGDPTLKCFIVEEAREMFQPRYSEAA